MTEPKQPTRYRPQGMRANRRRTVLIVLAAIVVVAIGLTLHVAGILPPE